MSVLALKALGYGADKIPDKIFHKVPGGFFTPPPDGKEQAKRRPPPEQKDRGRRQSERRYNDRDRRRAQRDRTPPTDYSDHSDRDREKGNNTSRRHRRRARSLERDSSRSRSRSSSRGRIQDRDQRGYQGDNDMDRAERAERGNYPPSGGEYRPYDPRDYAAGAAAGAAAADGYHDAYDHRASSAGYGYPPQVNSNSRSRSATMPVAAPHPTPLQMMQTKWKSRPPLAGLTPPFPFPSPHLEAMRSGTPLTATFSPSYEPSLAVLLSRPSTDPPQPASATAARYTPAPGYAPSPMSSAMPPPNPNYPAYNPAEYAPQNPNYRAPGNSYPSPPPFYRQSSYSQPSLAQPALLEGPEAYDQPSDRHGSVSSSRRRRRNDDDKRNRTRSASHHGRSASRITDQIRGRLERFDLKDKNLAASVGGALAGGFAGNQVGHGTLSTLIGAGIGAFGGREMEKRHEKSKAVRGSRDQSSDRRRSGSRRDRDRDYSRSPSRERRRDRFSSSESDTGSDYDDRRRGSASSRRRRSSRRDRDD